MPSLMFSITIQCWLILAPPSLMLTPLINTIYLTVFTALLI